MTWVVGGNCFNGFICVADIQATISFNNSIRKEYFNCVQKIHKICSNLCVAFSGDIRTGLIIVERLRLAIQSSYNEGEYFDIDGHSQSYIKFLKNNYEELNVKGKNHVEFIFLWNAQEGEEVIFRPFCMKFKSPDFNMNSTALPGVTQSGSGLRNSTYQAISRFLAGKKDDSEEYKRIFHNFTAPPNIFTVQIFKQILLHEASEIHCPGVSKTLISFESVIPYKDIYNEQTSKNLKEAYITLGISPIEVSTANYKLLLSSISPYDLKSRLDYLETNAPFLFYSLQSILKDALGSASIEPLTEIPPIRIDKIISNDEDLHVEKLITSWPEFVKFMKSKKINIASAHATA